MTDNGGGRYGPSGDEDEHRQQSGSWFTPTGNRNRTQQHQEPHNDGRQETAHANAAGQDHAPEATESGQPASQGFGGFPNTGGYPGLSGERRRMAEPYPSALGDLDAAPAAPSGGPAAGAPGTGPGGPEPPQSAGRPYAPRAEPAVGEGAPDVAYEVGAATPPPSGWSGGAEPYPGTGDWGAASGPQGAFGARDESGHPAAAGDGGRPPHERPAPSADRPEPRDEPVYDLGTGTGPASGRPEWDPRPADDRPAPSAGAPQGEQPVGGGIYRVPTGGNPAPFRDGSDPPYAAIGGTGGYPGFGSSVRRGAGAEDDTEPATPGSPSGPSVPQDVPGPPGAPAAQPPHPPEGAAPTWPSDHGGSTAGYGTPGRPASGHDLPGAPSGAPWGPPSAEVPQGGARDGFDEGPRSDRGAPWEPSRPEWPGQPHDDPSRVPGDRTAGPDAPASERFPVPDSGSAPHGRPEPGEGGSADGDLGGSLGTGSGNTWAFSRDDPRLPEDVREAAMRAEERRRAGSPEHTGQQPWPGAAEPGPAPEERPDPGEGGSADGDLGGSLGTGSGNTWAFSRDDPRLPEDVREAAMRAEEKRRANPSEQTTQVFRSDAPSGGEPAPGAPAGDDPLAAIAERQAQARAAEGGDRPGDRTTTSHEESRRDVRPWHDRDSAQPGEGTRMMPAISDELGPDRRSGGPGDERAEHPTPSFDRGHPGDQPYGRGVPYDDGSERPYGGGQPGEYGGVGGAGERAGSPFDVDAGRPGEPGGGPLGERPYGADPVDARGGASRAEFGERPSYGGGYGADGTEDRAGSSFGVDAGRPGEPDGGPLGERPYGSDPYPGQYGADGAGEPAGAPFGARPGDPVGSSFGMDPGRPGEPGGGPLGERPYGADPVDARGGASRGEFGERPSYGGGYGADGTDERPGSSFGARPGDPVGSSFGVDSGRPGDLGGDPLGDRPYRPGFEEETDRPHLTGHAGDPGYDHRRGEEGRDGGPAGHWGASRDPGEGTRMMPAISDELGPDGRSGGLGDELGERPTPSFDRGYPGDQPYGVGPMDGRGGPYDQGGDRPSYGGGYPGEYGADGAGERPGPGFDPERLGESAGDPLGDRPYGADRPGDYAGDPLGDRPYGADRPGDYAGDPLGERPGEFGRPHEYGSADAPGRSALDGAPGDGYGYDPARPGGIGRDGWGDPEAPAHASAAPGYGPVPVDDDRYDDGYPGRPEGPGTQEFAAPDLGGYGSAPAGHRRDEYGGVGPAGQTAYDPYAGYADQRAPDGGEAPYGWGGPGGPEGYPDPAYAGEGYGAPYGEGHYPADQYAPDGHPEPGEDPRARRGRGGRDPVAEDFPGFDEYQAEGPSDPYPGYDNIDYWPDTAPGAMATLWLGIIGLVPVVGLVTAIIALATGSGARRAVHSSGGELEGLNLVRIGTVFAWVGIVLFVIEVMGGLALLLF